jgi:transcriptional regulator with PAS, ATPase and Fis domain
MFKLISKKKRVSNLSEEIVDSYLQVLDFYNKGSFFLDLEKTEAYVNDRMEDILEIWNHNDFQLFLENIELDLIEEGEWQKASELQVKYSVKRIKVGNKFKYCIGLIQEFKRIEDPDWSLDFIIGKSPAIIEVKRKINKISKTDTTVLLIGETGTGKEVFAQAIHQLSARKKAQLVVINCGAIPDTLLESELFGYEKGSFSGANLSGKQGILEQANGGTLFLDEVENMSGYMQNKFLRVLEDRKFIRVGGLKYLPLDIRVIAATNQDLKEMSEQNIFRKDLLHRLNVITLKIPSLKERVEDIMLLSDYFIKKFNDKMNKNIVGVKPEVQAVFREYPWEGNVRELKNYIEYAMNFEEEQYISLNSLPEEMLILRDRKEAFKTKTLDEMEQDAIIKALDFYGWNEKGKSLAAKALGISRSSIYRKISKYFYSDD